MRKSRTFDYVLAFVIACIAMTLAAVVAFAAPRVPDADGVGRALHEQAAEGFPAVDPAPRLELIPIGWNRRSECAARNSRPRGPVVDPVEALAGRPDPESLYSRVPCSASCSAMRTRSASEPAPIFRIACAR